MKTSISDAFSLLFNWKKNPASVFFFAIPLALIGFGSLFMVALLKYRTMGDPWFLVIFGFAMALLAFALYPVRKHIARLFF